jgi:hypothetical protein
MVLEAIINGQDYKSSNRSCFERVRGLVPVVELRADTSAHQSQTHLPIQQVHVK